MKLDDVPEPVLLQLSRAELVREIRRLRNELAEVEKDRDEWRDQCAFVADAKDLAIRGLEKRLEVYATNDDGTKTYLGIGECDGIGCRDETIRLQDERIRKLQEMIDWLERHAQMFMRIDASPEHFTLQYLDDDGVSRVIGGVDLRDCVYGAMGRDIDT